MPITKRFNILFIILGLLFSYSAFAENFTYELKVDGMSCPFCAYGVEKKLKAIKGVEKVDVNIGKGSVLVKMRENSKLTKEQAEKSVKDAGFSLKDFKQKTGD